MSYTGALVKINGSSVPCLQGYKVQRAKLWKEAERNMEGEVRATFIGVFPKIELQVGYTDEAQMSALVKLLDRPFFTVEYFDVGIQAVRSAKYYAGDYDAGLYNKARGLYGPFTVSLVPVEKMK